MTSDIPQSRDGNPADNPSSSAIAAFEAAAFTGKIHRIRIMTCKNDEISNMYVCTYIYIYINTHRRSRAASLLLSKHTAPGASRCGSSGEIMLGR